MRKIIIAFIMLIVMLLYIQVFAQPIIEVVGDKVFDYGPSKQQQYLKHTFVIRNAGTDTLHIISVKGG